MVETAVATEDEFRCFACDRDMNNDSTYFEFCCELCKPDLVRVSHVRIWQVHGKPTLRFKHGPVIGYRGSREEARKFADEISGDDYYGYIDEVKALQVGDEYYPLIRDAVDFNSRYSEEYAPLRDKPDLNEHIVNLAIKLAELPYNKLNAIITLISDEKKEKFFGK